MESRNFQFFHGSICSTVPPNILARRIGCYGAHAAPPASPHNHQETPAFRKTGCLVAALAALRLILQLHGPRIDNVNRS